MGGEDGESAVDDEDMDRGSMHRLCPTYAQDINSPLRHVRTRIYFTSESHVHSLINVLRFSHLGTHACGGDRARLHGLELRSTRSWQFPLSSSPAMILTSTCPGSSAPAVHCHGIVESCCVPSRKLVFFFYIFRMHQVLA